MLSSSVIGSALLALAPGALGWKVGATWSSTYSMINYTTVTGIFLQDDPSTDPSTFDYTATNFGLINQSYPTDPKITFGPPQTQWQRFENYVNTLNLFSGNDVVYKVFWLARHGEGWHNAAESFYGTPAWNCYWGELDGNGTATWSDAALDDAGVEQAQVANRFWQQELEEQQIPAPQSYYSSPLTRCIQTALITFSSLRLPWDRPFLPTIKEFLRENISIHTCDRRSNKTYIHNLVPTWKFEPNFAEFDPLWEGTAGEVDSMQVARSRILLDEIFTEDDNTWISVTSHSGEIGTILEAIHHQPFSLNTGAVIPVLVKAERIYQAYPFSTIQPWAPAQTCNSPPITSLANGGCVCSSTAVAASATATPTSA